MKDKERWTCSGKAEELCDKAEVHDNGKATAVVQGPFACVTFCGRCVAEEKNDIIPCEKVNEYCVVE